MEDGVREFLDSEFPGVVAELQGLRGGLDGLRDDLGRWYYRLRVALVKAGVGGLPQYLGGDGGVKGATVSGGEARRAGVVAGLAAEAVPAVVAARVREAEAVAVAAEAAAAVAVASVPSVFSVPVGVQVELQERLRGVDASRKVVMDWVVRSMAVRGAVDWGSCPSLEAVALLVWALAEDGNQAKLMRMWFEARRDDSVEAEEGVGGGEVGLADVLP